MRTRRPKVTPAAVALVTLALALASSWAPPALGQIGGQTGGTLVIDDVEDLSLTANGVERDWISEWTFTEIALQAIDPTTETLSLTLAPDQTPLGVFRLTANNDTMGYFAKTCGVPMPSEPGESTATHPGDMTSFNTLSFFACVDPTASNMELQVILECYPQNPDSSFPKLYWIVSPAVGTTFEPVTLDLRSPDLVENDGGNTVEELLSQTRFLSFYLYGGPDFTRQEINLFFDDITLTDEDSSTSVGNDWPLYD